MSMEPASTNQTGVGPTIASTAELLKEVIALQSTIRDLGTQLNKAIADASLPKLSVGDWILIWLKQLIGIAIVSVIIGVCGSIPFLVLTGGAMLRR